ncbi:Putative peptidoglycan binding domain-containing protein [Nocardioides exalbidus]|uniref:Putative peptidoglycan binding domain-containing protein n=1 Tax=Nocardioides exalbidus TaxID=402596 RepID=A0A1H4NYM4_9ACTN|nr:peptidoglycan-binding domain-containing protein [Nocardioides exalbidus]SEB99762.1 Putative peptidoglycan binding domain-containing protein [Nocardioides exalbidus]
MGALLLVCVGGGGFWAGQAAVGTTPYAGDVPSANLTAIATRQSVGRALTLAVTAEQPKVPLTANMLTGVVTRSTGTVNAKQGSILYAVAGIPVRAVQGNEPFYRDLATGASGQDVAQLRGALVAMGYLTIVGDDFDTSTYYAVRAWQRDLGVEETGTVRLGELVAVPRLPAALLVDTKTAAPGNVLAGGEPLVSGARGAPRFTLVVAEEQARLIPKSATITMKYAGQRWRARIQRTEQTDAGDTTIVLTSLSGGPVCRSQCQLVPAGDKTSILAKVTIVPRTTGPGVPVASISTAPDGTTTVQVVDHAGRTTPTPVKVLASQDGVAVVDGLSDGDNVLVFGATTSEARQNPAQESE